MVVERAVRANSRSAILSLAVAAAEESADRRATPVFSGGAPSPTRERGPPCPTAGFESEETRANGQPRDMDRQGTLRWEHNPIYCSTFSCSTLWAPGRWAFVRKHPIRCADKSPWIGQETPLDSSRIPPSSHEQHPSKPCPEGTFFHSPAAVLFFKGMGIRKAENGGQERPGECRSAQERRGQRNDRF